MGTSKKLNRRLLAWLAILTMAVIVGLADRANATTYTWTTTSSGNWNDATWTNAGYPGNPTLSGDTAIVSTDITADQTLHINVNDATIGNLTFGDSTLTGGVFNNWTIDNGGTGNVLTTNNNASSAGITSNGGNNVISAAVALSTATPSGLSYNGTVFTVGSGSLSLTGGFTNTSGGYTLASGLMIVSGTALNTGDIRTGGTLRLASADGLGSGALYINSGTFQSSDNVLGVNGFTRSYGTGAGQFNFQASGSSISAYGGNLTLNIGGAAATIIWPTLFGTSNKIALGSATSNGTVLWKNPIQLTTTAGGAATQFLTALVGVGSVPEGDIQGGITEDTNAIGSIVIGTNTSGSSAMYGTIVFSVANSYTGSTQVAFGTLRIGNASALSGGNLYLGGYSGNAQAGSRGVIEGNNGSNSFGANGFTRAIGTGSGQVQFDAVANGLGGGFSAYGTTNTSADNLTVNLGGSGAQVTWGNTGFNMPVLVFGSRLANATVNFLNPLALGSSARNINVIQGVGTTPEVDMQGVISGTGGIVKQGGGTLRLSAANTFTGGTATGAGFVTLNNSLALQNSTVTVGAANSLKFSSGIGTFTLGGLAGSVSTGDLSLVDSGSAAIALIVGNNSANTTYTGALSGTGASLTKVGAGTLTMNGTNTYSGATAVNGGTLLLNFSTSVPSSNILYNGVVTPGGLSLANATLNITGTSSAITNNQGFGSFTVNAGGNGITLAPGSSGSGVKLTLGGSSWTRNGNGTVSVVITAAGTKTISTGMTGAAQSTTSAIIPYVNVNDGAGSNGFGYIDASGNLQRYTGQNTGSAPTSGNNSGTNYQIGNTGTLSLAGADTLNSLNILGSSTETINLNGFTLSLASGGIITTGSNTTVNVNGTGQLGASNAELIIATFTTNSSALFTINSTATISGGTGSLTKFGPQTLVVNSANTYTGLTSINGGTLRLGNTNAAQSSPVAVWAGSLTFTGAIGSFKTGGLLGTGNVALTDTASAAIALELAGASTGDYTYSGVLSGTGGSITKSTAGKETFTGANTYTGGTNVTGGTLVADNNAALGTGLANVTGGALEIAPGRTVTNAITLNGAGATVRVNGTIQTGSLTLTAGTLAGAGTVAQAVTAGSGVTLAPGSSTGSVGTLSTGSVSMTNAAMNVDVNFTSQTADQLSITGSLALNGSTLNINLLGGENFNAANKTYTLILNDGTSDYSGTGFTTVTSNAGSALGYFFGNGDGNDVTITFTAVPEPASLGMLGLAGLALRRRRRRSA